MKFFREASHVSKEIFGPVFLANDYKGKANSAYKINNQYWTRGERVMIKVFMSTIMDSKIKGRK